MAAVILVILMSLGIIAIILAICGSILTDSRVANLRAQCCQQNEELAACKLLSADLCKALTAAKVEAGLWEGRFNTSEGALASQRLSRIVAEDRFKSFVKAVKDLAAKQG